ncbi:YckD family protein [Robertmurraya sp. FSL R5-0851]|uniref:YckD family protein n=1 Tax=Robertmurraya sp. FSL R5-0851 TaxID=2921584 RepID=UPI0030F55F3A
MKKFVGVMAACLLSMSIFGATSSFAEVEKPEDANNTQEVKLTDAQKAELAKLHKGILEQKKQLIQKYAEFGVIPKEKADKMIQRYEEHYKMLEENGFIFKGPHGGSDRGPHGGSDRGPHHQHKSEE